MRSIIYSSVFLKKRPALLTLWMVGLLLGISFQGLQLFYSPSLPLIFSPVVQVPNSSREDGRLLRVFNINFIQLFRFIAQIYGGA